MRHTKPYHIKVDNESIVKSGYNSNDLGGSNYTNLKHT